MTFDVRRFDIYRKIPKDLTQPTYTGAIISVCCCIFIFILFMSEFLHFISTNVTSELFVDNASDTDRIPVQLNISLPRLSCGVVGLDIQDEKGRHEVGFVENIVKTPLGEDKEGCHVEGKFFINKVPGNFHISTHSAPRQPDIIDMAHYIHEVRFGPPLPTSNIQTSFNSMMGVDHTAAKDIETHDYVMKLVPSIYQYLDGKKVESYQYTHAYKSSISGRIIPAIWFKYDLTPITVKYTESRQPLYSFLTSVCAIVGGTFTVAGIIDSIVFTASQVFRKFELGKLS